MEKMKKCIRQVLIVQNQRSKKNYFCLKIKKNRYTVNTKNKKKSNPIKVKFEKKNLIKRKKFLSSEHRLEKSCDFEDKSKNFSQSIDKKNKIKNGMANHFLTPKINKNLTEFFPNKNKEKNKNFFGLNDNQIENKNHKRFLQIIIILNINQIF